MTEPYTFDDNSPLLIEVTPAEAADFLRTRIGQNHNALEWCAVRPDTLTNETETTEYEVFPSPVRSAIFDPGRTSRLNVARFIADLIADDDTWGIEPTITITSLRELGGAL